MIFVERTTVDKPKALVGKDSKAEAELKKARQHFQKTDPGSFEFQVYKDTTVKTALKELFHGKCAYCETKYDASQPVDIEHYRPKGAVMVDGKPVKPGYWWLAADWDNLLPSCIDCNRRRNQTTAEGKKGSSGKANLFPISDEKKRAREEGGETNEEPLLLDPCRHRPEEYLTFGDEGVVRTHEKATGVKARVAAESVAVYGLNRSGLASQRKNLSLLLAGRLITVETAATACAANNDDAEQRKELADVLRQLQQDRNAKSAYAALARQSADQVLDDARGFVTRHYEQQLKQKKGEPDDILARFIQRFATPEGARSLKKASTGARSALAL